jgi:PKD repeat protein
MALYATYDPLKGWMWYFNDVGDGHDLTLLTKDGLVAIKSTWDTLPPNGPETIIRCDIYDPKLGKWGHGIGGDQTFFAHTIGPLSISNATLHFTETYLGQVANWVVGYRPDYQHPLDCPWSNILATNTLAYFVAQPTSSSSSPLWVWFTDMSIAGGTWSYNFGDATVISLARSPHHTYNFPGVFQVTQLVSLLGANSTYSQNISIGWPIMLKGKVPPFLYLLLLSD